MIIAEKRKNYKVFQKNWVSFEIYWVYHTRALVVLGGLPVISENEKMSDKPQTPVDILKTLYNSP